MFSVAVVSGVEKQHRFAEGLGSLVRRQGRYPRRHPGRDVYMKPDHFGGTFHKAAGSSVTKHHCIFPLIQKLGHEIGWKWFPADRLNGSRISAYFPRGSRPADGSLNTDVVITL